MLYIILKFFILAKFNNQFDYQLKAVDSYINRGYFEKALENLNFITEKPGDDYSALRLLKRHYIIANQLNKFKDLKKISFEFLDLFPDNGKIESVYVYSILKLNEDGRALKFSKKFLDDKKFNQYLFAEAVLKTNSIDQHLDLINKLDGDIKRIITLDKSTNSNDFISLFDKYQNKDLILNAVLYLLKEGEIKSAADYFEKNIGYSIPDLGAYIYYDLEDYLSALDYSICYTDKTLYNKDWSLFIADIYLKLKDNENALKIYLDFINVYPDYSYIPYYNILFLDSSFSNLDILQRAVERFPKVPEINLALSSAYVKTGDLNSAISILEKFLTYEPENLDAVLQYNFLNSYTSPERYIGVLWNIFNKNPNNNEKIPISLLWYLSGFNEIDEMEKVLTLAEKNYGNIYWVDFYKGIVNILKSRYKEAYRFFKNSQDDSYYRKDDFYIKHHALYNCALLSYSFGDYKSAYDELKDAESKIKNGNNVLLSKIRTLFGKIFLAENNYSKATREFNLAVDLDKENIEALYYLKVSDKEEKDDYFKIN